jgi:hypothetical protein
VARYPEQIKAIAYMEAEMTAYRAPFLARGARLPTLVWPRQIRIEGEPADVTQIVKQSSQRIAARRALRLRAPLARFISRSSKNSTKKGLTEWREVGVGFHDMTPFHRASSRSPAVAMASGKVSWRPYR